MADHSGFLQDQFWHNGPRPGSLYHLPGGSTYAQNGPAKHTLQPMTTGTSVIGLKFDGGVMIAADTLGSYGSLARFRDISRIYPVNENTIFGASGDIADFQFMKSIVEQKIIDEECLDDGHGYKPKALFSWLTRVMYNRRSKFNPLWNVYVVAGMQDDEPFLGYVNMIGTAYQAPTIANGFGSYIAQPILREAYEKNNKMTLAEAKEVITKCMRVLFYRDARSYNRFEIAYITKDGPVVEPPVSADTNWEIAHYVKGYE
ncbi:proteasome subunit beta type-4-like [Ptychodera flava]|uniref:proteasome subunit beta type-4-like n=1 Tax=Ptychodera flava TaxID=63121 RepID=UPI00396A024C